ncbi:MAG: ubiquitin-like domain-containing protein, partial [Acutalibacteraceae bacterium]|nr:ubiquitin-like domain-containing protein [Acutalibacteraceae bacterium]
MITKIKTKAKSMSGFKKFIAIALVLALLTSITAFANENTGYNVEIYDGETKITIYTNATSAAEVIKESGLSVTALDKVDLSGFEVGEDSKISIKRSNFVGISDAQ